MSPVLPFVGRKDKMAKILDWIQKRQSVWISGPAGVGKTYLVENLKRCVLDEKRVTDYMKEYELDSQWLDIECLFAQTGSGQQDAAQAMEKLLQDLERESTQQECSSNMWREACEDWRETYKRYKDLLWRAERDLDAPPNLRQTLALLSIDAMGGMVEILASSAAAASGDPMALGVAGTAQKIVPVWGEQIKDYLKAKFQEHDRELLYRPIQELAPRLKKAISQLGSKSENVRIVLVLDEYELTCISLEGWLRSLFEDDEDFLRQCKVVILILSQYPLPKDDGASFYSKFSEIWLEPFDYIGEDEIGAYVRLILGNQIDPQVHSSEYIYRQSEGLPFVVEAIVQVYIQPQRHTVHTAVQTALRRLDERILKLIKEDSLKQLVRLCAVSQQLNVDVFEDVKRFMLEKRGCDVMKIPIKWLESQPFVKDWRYDPTVRILLSRNLYNRSPRDYEDLNHYLGEIYTNEIQTRDLSGREWCETQARRWYHALAASPRKSLAKALAAFVESFKYYRPDDPLGTTIVLDIVGILEDLRKVRQDEEAFSLWSDYVSGFRKEIEDKDNASGENWNEYYLELYNQLVEFHFHHELGAHDSRLRAYQDYDGFTYTQVIDYLKHSGERFHQQGDYEQAYRRFRKALEQDDQDEQTRNNLFLSLVCLADENPHEAQECFQEDEELLNQMLSELTEDLSNRFTEIRETVLNA